MKAKMQVDDAYRWMAWGTFCTAIHLNAGDIQVFPPFVGFLMVAYGMAGLGKTRKGHDRKEKAEVVLKPAMILLILCSLAEFISGYTEMNWIFRGSWFVFVMAVLEFTAYFSSMFWMEKLGANVSRWRFAYLIAGVTGLSAGVGVVLSMSAAAIMFMALAMLTGRMIFFCCVWGESRTERRRYDG